MELANSHTTRNYLAQILLIYNERWGQWGEVSQHCQAHYSPHRKGKIDTQFRHTRQTHETDTQDKHMSQRHKTNTHDRHRRQTQKLDIQEKHKRQTLNTVTHI